MTHNRDCLKKGGVLEDIFQIPFVKPEQIDGIWKDIERS